MTLALVLRIVRIDILTSGILTTSGNTSSQKSQTVGDFYDVIGRIGIISTLKVLSKTSQTLAIFTMSVNLPVLRIAIVVYVRIPVSANRKNPRLLRFLGQVGSKWVCIEKVIASELAHFFCSEIECLLRNRMFTSNCNIILRIMILGRVYWNPRVIKYNHNTKIEVPGK